MLDKINAKTIELLVWLDWDAARRAFVWGYSFNELNQLVIFILPVPTILFLIFSTCRNTNLVNSFIVFDRL